MRSALLVTALGLAACAAASPGPSPTPNPSPSRTSSPTPNPFQTLTPSPTPFPMKPPTATEVGPELQAIGLDPKSLPPLGKLQPDQLRKVMPLIAKSLGVKCTACHVWNTDGPPPKTPRMKVAEEMWNHFVRGLTTAEGAPVFCDSCHHGAVQVLERAGDRQALATWMKESFVDKLARADGKEHGCPTCHGSGVPTAFIHLWKERG